MIWWKKVTKSTMITFQPSFPYLELEGIRFKSQPHTTICLFMHDTQLIQIYHNPTPPLPTLIPKEILSSNILLGTIKYIYPFTFTYSPLKAFTFIHSYLSHINLSSSNASSSHSCWSQIYLNTIIIPKLNHLFSVD